MLLEVGADDAGEVSTSEPQVFSMVGQSPETETLWTMFSVNIRDPRKPPLSGGAGPCRDRPLVVRQGQKAAGWHRISSGSNRTRPRQRDIGVLGH
ncbi:hypothetical protein Q8A73_000160 [Channa argus]|nr:hypothetical protein Q8A73_000160 [Channa argus]